MQSKESQFGQIMPEFPKLAIERNEQYGQVQNGSKAGGIKA